MDTLIELILLAAAAYGAKMYFFTPEKIQNKEIFSTRAATFAKRIVDTQLKPCCDTAKNLPAADNEDGNGEVPASLEQNTIPVSETVQVSEPTTVELAPEPELNQTTDMQPSQKSGTPIPEDSVLRRHYFAGLAAQQSNISNPYPTDSVLRRHYDQRQIALLNVPTNLQVTETADETHIADAANQPAPITAAKRVVPEDSVLKRHFLSQIHAQIESRNSPRPTDAVLKRHHDQLLQSQLNSYMAELA